MEGGGYHRRYVDSLFERWVLRMRVCKIDYIRVSKESSISNELLTYLK